MKRKFSLPRAGFRLSNENKVSRTCKEMRAACVGGAFTLSLSALLGSASCCGMRIEKKLIIIEGKFRPVVVLKNAAALVLCLLQQQT
jgi:hypothetical protein